MLEKLKGEPAKLIVWVIALVVVGVLVGLGKAKPEVLEIVLGYLAGAVGRTVSNRVLPEKEESQ